MNDDPTKKEEKIEIGPPIKKEEEKEEKETIKTAGSSTIYWGRIAIVGGIFAVVGLVFIFIYAPFVVFGMALSYAVQRKVQRLEKERGITYHINRPKIVFHGITAAIYIPYYFFKYGFFNFDPDVKITNIVS